MDANPFLYHVVDRRRRHRDPYVVLLFLGLIQKISQLDYKPPVTIALIIVNCITYFGGIELVPPAVWNTLQNSALQPKLILERGEWRRLVLSAFLHLDELHLYYNMSSLLWKGVQLERRYGHRRFALLVAELLLLTHGLYVLVALLVSDVGDYRHLYHTVRAAGFSGVLFGLKVVLNHNAPGSSEVLGFSVPTKYLCWAELLLASLMVPNCSFLGHLCGILAGLLHVRLVEPGLSSWARSARRWRNYQPGRSAGRRLAGEPDTARARASTGTGSGSGFTSASGGYGPRAGGSSGAARGGQGPVGEEAGGSASGWWQRPDGDDEDAEGDAEGDAAGGSGPLSPAELRRRRLQRLEREQQGPRYRSTGGRRPSPPQDGTTVTTGIDTRRSKQHFSCGGILGGGASRGSGGANVAGGSRGADG